MYPSRCVSRGMGHRYHKNTTKARQRIGLYHRITTIKHEKETKIMEMKTSAPLETPVGERDTGIQNSYTMGSRGNERLRFKN